MVLTNSQNKLVQAIQNRASLTPEQIKNYIQELVPTIDTRNFKYEGHSILHLAAEFDRVDIIAYVFNNFPEVDKELKDGKHEDTLLHTATVNTSRQTIEYLISQKINLDAKDKEGFTALHLAIDKDDIYIDAAKLLLNTLSNDYKGKIIEIGKFYLYQKGNFEKALLCFDSVLSSDPNHVDTLESKGITLYFQGQYKQANYCFDKVLAVNPNHPAAWRYKGHAYYAQELLSQALSCYENAIEAITKEQGAIQDKPDKRKPDTAFSKGLIFFCQKDFNNAEKEFEKILNDNPNHLEASQGMALILLKNNNKNAAEKLQNEVDNINIAALKSKAKQVKYYVDYGDMLMAIGERDRAKEVYSKAQELWPNYNLLNKRLQALESSKQQKWWHFNSEARQISHPAPGKPYILIPARQDDIEKVCAHYSHHPVPGMDITNIEIIYNPVIEKAFKLRLKALQQRAKNPAFNVDWKETETKEEEKAREKGDAQRLKLLEQQRNQRNAWRIPVNNIYEELAKPYVDKKYPDVKLLPLWHGTKQESLKSLFSTGYANLGTTDTGYFGKGIYSAYEAEYSYNVYSKKSGVLIFNWVASYKAYPIVHYYNNDNQNPDKKYDKTKQMYEGKSNYSKFDAHFVPVVPKDPNMENELDYFPPIPLNNSIYDYKYTEMVVFESAQCLPRYLVRLQSNTTSSRYNLFSNKLNRVTSLYEAAYYIYKEFLSKPYTLQTNKTDWEYKYDGITIPRPNHGLAHTLRKVFYVPYVIEYYLEHQSSLERPSLTAEAKQILLASRFEVQLELLFSVVGRENETSWDKDKDAYERFAQTSNKAFKDYIERKKICLQYFYNVDKAIMDHIKAIKQTCHCIDLIRCLTDNEINQKGGVKDTIIKYVGENNYNSLIGLAYHCLVSTGNRVLDFPKKHEYNHELFIKASRNVLECVQLIQQGIEAWRNDSCVSINKSEYDATSLKLYSLRR